MSYPASTGMVRIPLFDASREYAAQADDLADAARRVLVSGRYILGPEVDAFEQEMAQHLGVAHAVGVANGTDALELALRASGIASGDGVVTSPLTFFATVSAILRIGAVPVFVDVESEALTLDPQAVRHVLNGSSPAHTRLGISPDAIKSVVPVHLHGQPAEMGELLGIAAGRGVVIEDAAQAVGAVYRGAPAGTVGDAGCFSFFPSKNLGGFGDGGLIATDDAEVAGRIRALGRQGAVAKHRHVMAGCNSRLDELQAALLRVRLARLDAALCLRHRHAAIYDTELAGVAGIRTPTRIADRRHAQHLYAIRVEDKQRGAVRAALAAEGIETGIHYPVPAHLQEAARPLGYRPGDFPTAEAAGRELISLPLFPTMEEGDVMAVVTALRRAIDTGSPRVQSSRARRRVG